MVVPHIVIAIAVRMRIATVGCSAVDSWPVAPTEADPRPWEGDERPLHAALRSRGATVVTPAWDDPSVDWSVFDAVLVRTTWDYHHDLPRFLAWADHVETVAPLLNAARTVRWNTRKTYLRELPVPQIDTVWIEGPVDLGAVLRERGWDRAFLKPIVGANANGTLRFRADPEGLRTARDHVATWLPRGGLMLQPYLPSVETLGERSAIAIDGEITHFVRKIPVPGDYRVQDDHGATDEVHDPDPAERALCDATLQALGALADPPVYARVDWLVGADGPKLVELELVEPSLFFRHGPRAAVRLCDAVLRAAVSSRRG